MICVKSLQLQKLTEWFKVNKLSLNIAKSSYMVFGRKKNVPQILSLMALVWKRLCSLRFKCIRRPSIQLDSSYETYKHENGKSSWSYV